MDTVATVSYSQVRGLVLTSKRGQRVHVKEDLAGFMLAYSFDTPNRMPETGTPWQRVAAAAADWKYQLQAELTQSLAHDGFDGAWTADDWAEPCAASDRAAAVYLAGGGRFVVPMQLPTDDDVPEYGNRA